jgi:hypothetical protein
MEEVECDQTIKIINEKPYEAGEVLVAAPELAAWVAAVVAPAALVAPAAVVAATDGPELVEAVLPTQPVSASNQ